MLHIIHIKPDRLVRRRWPCSIHSPSLATQYQQKPNPTAETSVPKQIMRSQILMIAASTYISTALGAITWTLEKSTSPTADESAAYSRIEDAMTAAVARHQRLTPNISKAITVQYSPGVPTAEANYNGDLRFGSDASYQTERTALHEIAHTLGVGQRQAFDDHCASGDWPTATPLLRSWDGDAATIACGGGHFWPYGLNYETEWSDESGDRHCLIVAAMLDDGMAAY
jgi:hypothetical protein